MKLIISVALVLAALCAVIYSACITDCRGLKDGDYQSCLGCDVYATCSNHNLHDNRTCGFGRVWDDTEKQCEHESTTCP